MMFQPIKSLLYLSFLSLVSFSSQPSLGKSVEQTVSETGVLKVGVRQDSPLFGYGENPSGYCVDFAQKLTTLLTEKLNKPINLELIPSTTQTRWNLVKDKTVHLECGPNTINEEREADYGIKFSRPFFVTATQIFTQLSTTEETVKQGNIGVINNTTNEQDIRQIYPPQQVNNTFANRTQGIQAVQAGLIQGFASDGILLMGTTLGLKMNPTSYNIVTPYNKERPFCATYGMILPPEQENESWRSFVNQIIAKSGKGEAVWDEWFLPFFPYLSNVLQGCQSDNQKK
ncbi:MAG: transporter substrate-binding domain-containing protein [Crocosphaera sp.]